MTETTVRADSSPSDTAPSDRFVVPWAPSLAGAVSAGVALSVGELISSLGGADHTLITSVGTSFIDRFAGILKGPAVAIFGTNDKPALIIGTVIIALALGALAGRQARTRPWLPPVLFGGFAVLGMVAGATDPLASTAFTLMAAPLAAAAGVVCLRALLGLAADPTSAGEAPPPRFEDPRNPASSRRAFFGWTGAAGAFAAVAAGGSRRIGPQVEVEAARQAISLPKPTAGGNITAGGTTTTLEPVVGPGGAVIEGLSPYLTPNDRFYKIDTSLISPRVDVSTWKLEITGLVDRPYSLSFDELVAMADTEETVTIACVSNEVGDTLVGNARWQGVPLRRVLERAGVKPEAGQIVGISVDGFTAGFPTEALDTDRIALVAVAMNGEPLPVDHGFPARLIIAGLYGYVSATKWLQEIRLTTWEGFDGYWMPRGWSKNGPVKTQSRIDVPRRSTPVKAGPTPIAGVAWAPTRAINKVEVQVDDGPWREAKLGDVVSGSTWRQWVAEWDASPGDHRLRVRATDGTGETQTENITAVAPDGATGWHTVNVRVDG